jgi:predicted transcriptional regulator
MAAEDNNYEATEIAADLKSALLPPLLLERIQELRAQTILDMCDLEIVGTPEEITTAIGNHHLLRGRKQAFEELLDNHTQAMSQISA